MGQVYTSDMKGVRCFCGIVAQINRSSRNIAYSFALYHCTSLRFLDVELRVGELLGYPYRCSDSLSGR